MTWRPRVPASASPSRRPRSALDGTRAPRGDLGRLFEKPPRVIKVFPRFAEEGLRDMLLLLILIAWLTLIVFVVNLCRGASPAEAPRQRFTTNTMRVSQAMRMSSKSMSLSPSSAKRGKTLITRGGFSNNRPRSPRGARVPSSALRGRLLGLAEAGTRGRHVIEHAGPAPGAVVGRPYRGADQQGGDEYPPQGGRAHAHVLQARGGHDEGDQRPDVAIGSARGEHRGEQRGRDAAEDQGGRDPEFDVAEGERPESRGHGQGHGLCEVGADE